MIKYIHFILLNIILLISQAYSQQYNFSNYSVEQGLAQSTVYSICEDSRGYLWFGTFGGGASRFDGSNFVNFTTDDGLGNNQLYKIIEDSKGNLWFGTRDGGVCKYDGKKFRQFTENDGLSGNTIRAILEDSHGLMWFGSDGGGISKYDGKKFTNFTVNNGLASNRIYSIMEDSKGNLWFATYSGVSMFDGKIFTTFDENNGLTNTTVRTIIEDRAGNIWIGTFGGGVFKHTPDDVGQSSPKFIDYSEKVGLQNKKVMSIIEDSDSNLWFGTLGGGVSMYNGDFFINYTEREGIGNNNIMSIMEDSYGNMWFGTFGGGVSMLGGKTFIHCTVESGLNDNNVQSIIEDRYGNMWFGTFSGGVSMFDGTDITNFTEKNGFCYNNAFSIIEDRKGNLWFGTNGGGVCKYDGTNFYNLTTTNGLSSNQVWTIIEDNSGNLWFGTYGNGICMYDGVKFTTYTDKEGLVDNSIFSIIEDRSGNIWIGTYGGLSRLTREFDADSGKISGVTFTNYTKKDGLLSNQIRSLVEDSSPNKSGQAGNIWIGTYGGGVNKLVLSDNEKSAPSISYITKKDGLGSNNIYLMIFDDMGNLWTGGEKGIDRIEFNSEGNVKNIKHYGKLEGFAGVECTNNAVCKDNKGNLWFGTINGVSKYNPNEDIADTIEPKTYITSLRLFFKEVDWADLTPNPSPVGEGSKSHPSGEGSKSLPLGVDLGEVKFDGITKWYHLPVNLVLPYYQNHLTFEFIGINMRSLEEVRYQWKLEGFDEEWSPITYKNEATYSNIPHGEYTFKVKACNKDGVWNAQPTTYCFITILPPFWKTWWFRTLLLVIVSLVIFGYIKRRERNLQKQKKVLEIKVEERTAEIREKNVVLQQQKEEIQVQAEKLEITNEELEKLSIVARETDNSVVIADKNGNIEWVNEGFKRLFGYTFEEFKQLKGANIIDASSNPDIKSAIKKCIEKKESIVYSTQNTTKSGKKIWTQTTLTPILSPEGNVLKLVAIDSEITKIKEAEEKIKAKNIQITDSINYAKRIQDSILLSEEEIQKYLPDSFIYFQPRDIVSGDFYWFSAHPQTGGAIIIAAIDCTGHGVPGAFMSMIGNMLLNKIVNEKHITDPEEILNRMHIGVLTALQQEKKDAQSQDGMDMALCVIDTENKQIQYAGAMNPLYIIRNNEKSLLKKGRVSSQTTNIPELIEIKPDSRSIGGISLKKEINTERKFTTHTIDIQKGTVIYMFTDGYIDQFGGEKNTRFTSSRFKQLLLNNYNLDMQQQKISLSKTMEEWKGDLKQIDDILVMGIRI